MTRRETLAWTAAALALALAPRRTAAQASRTIGELWPSTPERISPFVTAFHDGLRTLGHVEGRNVVFLPRYGEEPGALADRAMELVSRKPDVIVTAGEAPTRALKDATTAIPVVMAVSGDPVGAKFVASLAHPGGNITGLSALSPELSAKRLDVLKQAFPRASRVAVLWNVTNPVKRLDMLQTEVAAKTLGLTLLSIGVRGPDELESAFADIRKGRAEVIVTLADELTVSRRDRIVHLAAPTRLPTVYELRDFVDAGGLMSYGPSLPDLFRRAATYVDKILKGARPGDLPIEQPTKFELVVNTRTAQAIGVTIPPAVLQRADQVLP